MNYTIKRGDTLSALASRFHTTVGALASANHISNPNLIIAGHTLKIPGDGFTPSKPKPAPKPGPTASGSTSNTAFNIAKSELGKNASSLKLENSPVGRAMEDWVPNTECC